MIFIIINLRGWCGEISVSFLFIGVNPYHLIKWEIIYDYYFFHSSAAKTAEEDIAVKSVKQETKLSRSEVLKVLMKANLTNHGYKEEVSYQKVKGPGSNKFYFKVSTAIFAQFHEKNYFNASLKNYIGFNHFCFWSFFQYWASLSSIISIRQTRVIFKLELVLKWLFFLFLRNRTTFSKRWTAEGVWRFWRLEEN